MIEKLETNPTSLESEEKKYKIYEFKGKKELIFELITHPNPSVAELIEIIKKEFPEVPLEELVITSGDEVFVVEKKKE